MFCTWGIPQMKHFYLAIIFAVALIFGCSRSDLPQAPDGIDLADYPWAAEELQELIDQCGKGVVEGEDGENRCSYQVKIDEWMLRHPVMKTGYLHDPEWAHQAGETWFQATAPATIPDKFDLRDFMPNGQPEIKAQQCGDCWAWATHHGLEIARAIHDKTALDHSVQTVLSCSGAGSCRGGYMTAPLFLVGRGLPMEPEFPYAARDAKCKYSQSEMQAGWTGQVEGVPNIGSSLMESRFFLVNERSPVAEGSRVQRIMEAIYTHRSPAVVTVSAYSAGPGIVDSCGAINSGGNHMVAITGWEKDSQDRRIAHVWNSWGKGHGENGVSRLLWECGEGRLNRGLGISARLIQYKPPCDAPTAKIEKPKYMVLQGGAVKLGQKAPADVSCKWLPTEGVEDPNSCETWVSPQISTEYHMVAKNDCGETSSMGLVEVWGPNRQRISEEILTPHGKVTLSGVR